MGDESKSLVPAPPSCHDPPHLVDRRGVAVIAWRLITCADTTPLTPPQVPEDLPEMPALVRIHACLRLFLLDVEYAISPGGHLRGICKLGVRINVVVAVLSICLAGILAGMALVLAGVVIITGQVVQVLWNLVVSVLLVVALLAIAGICLLALRVILGSGESRSGSFADRRWR